MPNCLRVVIYSESACSDALHVLVVVFLVLMETFLNYSNRSVAAAMTIVIEKSLHVLAIVACMQRRRRSDTVAELRLYRLEKKMSCY